MSKRVALTALSYLVALPVVFFGVVFILLALIGVHGEKSHTLGVFVCAVTIVLPILIARRVWTHFSKL